jgi:hypothetical protein
MPEVSADFRDLDGPREAGHLLRRRPGLQGRQAARAGGATMSTRSSALADPANKQPGGLGSIASLGIVGLAELRERARSRQDRPSTTTASPRACARWTATRCRSRWKGRARASAGLASSDLLGAHRRARWSSSTATTAWRTRWAPGPFRLKQWRRSSLIVLERNPDYRERLYDAEPGGRRRRGPGHPGQPEGQALPMVDEVEISIIDEEQPRWLSFLNGELDASLASKYGAVPGQLRRRRCPAACWRRTWRNRASRQAPLGERRHRLSPTSTWKTRWSAAIRREGGAAPRDVLALDVDREIRIIRRGQAIPAQSLFIAPGYHRLRPGIQERELGRLRPGAREGAARPLRLCRPRRRRLARAARRLAPGARDKPPSPTSSAASSTKLWRRTWTPSASSVRFETGQWAEQLKAARAGKLQIWALGSSAAGTDGHSAVSACTARSRPSAEPRALPLAEFDALYDACPLLPDGPEREALFLQAKKIAGWPTCPTSATVHRSAPPTGHPWLIGYRRPLFWNEWWHMVDIDRSANARQ